MTHTKINTSLYVIVSMSLGYILQTELARDTFKHVFLLLVDKLNFHIFKYCMLSFPTKLLG